MNRSITARTVAGWSLAVTAASLPLYVVRWRVGPVPTTLLEVLILLTAAAYVATLASERRLPSRTGYEIPIVLLLSAGVIGVLVSPDRLRAAGIYRAYFIEAVAVFYVAADLLRTRDDLKRFLFVAGAGSCAMALGQIVYFVVVLAQGHLLIGDAPAVLNTSANAVAMYLEPPIAFAAAFAIYPSRPDERRVAMPVLGLLLLAMILTLSRAGYLAVAVLAVVYVLQLPSRRLIIWSLTGLLVFATLVAEVPFIHRRVVTFGYSLDVRWSIFNQAFHMLSQRPLVGAGISGFPVRVAPFRPPTEVVELYPHNLWLTTWSELGLLGLLAFAIIFFGLLWRGVKALRLSRDFWTPLLWGCVGALVLYLVHGIFDSPYWKNDLSVLFWVIAALEVAAIRAMRTVSAGADRAATQQPPEVGRADHARL